MEADVWMKENFCKEILVVIAGPTQKDSRHFLSTDIWGVPAWESSISQWKPEFLFSGVVFLSVGTGIGTIRRTWKLLDSEASPRF